MRVKGPRLHKAQFRAAPNLKQLRLSPLRILVDTREQTPWTFQSIRADKKDGGGTLYIPREIKTLETGDYSIDGYQEEVTVERKSPTDLLGTLSKGRERFEREHERMAAMGAGNALVIIEAPLIAFIRNRFKSRMSPKTIHRTFVSWTAKYGVPWYFVDSRRLAEITCYRFLEKWWEQRKEAEAPDAGKKEERSRKLAAFIATGRH